MSDRFESTVESISSPAYKAVSPAVNDTEDLPEVTKAIHCNSGGTLVVIMADDDTPRSFTLVAGAYYPYRIRRILETGTTAAVMAFV